MCVRTAKNSSQVVVISRSSSDADDHSSTRKPRMPGLLKKARPHDGAPDNVLVEMSRSHAHTWGTLTLVCFFQPSLGIVNGGQECRYQDWPVSSRIRERTEPPSRSVLFPTEFHATASEDRRSEIEQRGPSDLDPRIEQVFDGREELYTVAQPLPDVAIELEEGIERELIQIVIELAA